MIKKEDAKEKFLVVNTYVTLTREFFKMPAILSKIING